MLRPWIVAASLGAGLTFGLPQSAPAQSFDPKAIARDTYAEIRQTLCPPPGAPPINFDTLYDVKINGMQPGKIFDNLYVLGLKTVVAWALTTPDGIILFESMFEHNVKEQVVDGLVKLGLNPADIKYVIVTHAHIDHYGGAKYLQDTYGARIVMSTIDWDYMHSAPSRTAPPQFPRYDIAVRDGATITLGGTTVNLYLTPGHTPGTLSAIFPVSDGGQTHYVAYLGYSGTAGRSAEDLLQYMSSTDRFARLDKRVDVGISNHPMADGMLFKRAALDKRKAGEPHPFVEGNAGVKQWLSVVHDCAGEVLEQRLAETRAARSGPPR